MAALFETGRIADVILALVAIEAVALLILWRSRGRGIPPAGLLFNLASGACLLLALRSALVQGAWQATAAWLAAALLAHLADLYCRWR